MKIAGAVNAGAFYTYTYPQRLGGAIDWYRILAAKNRRDFFRLGAPYQTRTAARPAIQTVWPSRWKRLSGCHGVPAMGRC
jgi:hypothetical protein